MVQTDVKIHNMKNYLTANANVVCTTKDIGNYSRKISKKRKEVDLEAFKEALDLDVTRESGMVLREYTVGNDLIGIFSQFQWQRVFLNKYPEHIIMDATYSLINNRMPLYIAIVVDSRNNSIPFCLVAYETSHVIDFFMNSIIECNDIQSRVLSYMTDKDFTEIEVMKKYFPTASQELCLYHVNTLKH